MTIEKDTHHNGPETHTGRARALSNVALVKYFGKRDLRLNLPAASSVSVALEPLVTTTAVTFAPMFTKDEVVLNDAAAPENFTHRVSGFLDLFRRLSGVPHRARVDTRNAFPTAAGLASSASGFAALTVAAAAALDLSLDEPALSVLARRGSGSAARSIPGGIAVWQAGEREDGSDSYATRIDDGGKMDLRILVGVCDPGPKSVGSTEAMEQTRLTSPYYQRWVACAAADTGTAIRAVETGDLEALGEVTEHSALAMHAAILATRPGIIFWKGPTVEGLHLARRLRKEGLPAYFTCDAGPQPKLLTDGAHEAEVAAALSELPGIVEIIRCRPGGGATVID